MWPLSTATGPCSGSARSACTTNQRDRPLARAAGSGPVAAAAGVGNAATGTSAVSARAAAGPTAPADTGGPGVAGAAGAAVWPSAGLAALLRRQLGRPSPDPAPGPRRAQPTLSPATVRSRMISRSIMWTAPLMQVRSHDASRMGIAGRYTGAPEL